MPINLIYWKNGKREMKHTLYFSSLTGQVMKNNFIYDFDTSNMSKYGITLQHFMKIFLSVMVTTLLHINLKQGIKR